MTKHNLQCKSGTKFTADELAYVYANFQIYSRVEIASTLGRSPASIRNLCYQRGWVDYSLKWSAKEIETLVTWYTRAEGNGRDTLDLDGLAKQLGREKCNICAKAKTLGLTSLTRKLQTPEARKAASERQKKNIAENGHPRGALGIVHSAETRAKLGAKSRAGWASMREIPLLMEARRIKTAKTNLERYGIAGTPRPANAYSRCRRGVRADLGFFVRSRWEANYARYLNWLKARGDIASWEYEPQTFRFDGVTRGPYTYLPDFKVVELSGKVVFHEVKGWMDPASRNRLKRFAKFYPDVLLIVVDKKAYRQIESKLSTIIPHWEHE